MPGEHKLHAECANRSAYVPSEHGTHPTAPEILLYVPLLQYVQSPAFANGAYCPSGHMMQKLSPVNENFPGRHATHDEFTGDPLSVE